MLPERVAATVNIGRWCLPLYCVLDYRRFPTSARGAIFGRGGSLEFPFPVAVKTGTSQAYHDNWTIGYTRDVTVGVWVGNFDRTPLKSSTGLPGLRRSSMRSCSPRPNASTARQGSTLAPSSPCRTASSSAKCALPACRRTLVPGAPARTVATGQRSALQLASLERRRAARHLAAGAPPVGEAERLDDRDGASSDERFDRPAVALPPPTVRDPLEIVNPPAGATYLIDPTLRREFQTLPLRVVAASPGTIEWQVAGRVVGRRRRRPR